MERYCLMLAFLIMSATFFAQGDNVSSTTLMVFPFEGISKNLSINNLELDNNGVIWCAAQDGVYIIDPGNNRSVLKLSAEGVTDILSDNTGRMWASVDNTLYNVGTKEKIILPNDGNIVDIEFFDSQIWMATDKGLFAFRPRTGRIERYHPNNSKLESNEINFVHADRHNILWIGTEKGYIRVEGENWEVQDKDYRMIVTEENNEGQWIISEDDMFLLNKFNRLFPVGIDGALYSGNINAFTFDRDGRIYIASDKLVRYDPYNEIIEDFSPEAGYVSGKSLSILKDKNDNIWIGTEQSGLYLLQFSDIISNDLSVNCVAYRQPSCKGSEDGHIGVVVNGGIPPYSFSWENTTLRKDELTQLNPGKYTVTVTDHIGDFYVSSVTLVEPEEIAIDDIFVTQLSGPDKYDGTITIKPKGGTGSYQYSWNNGSRGERLTGLRGGLYQVTITDANGCTATASAEIEKIRLIPDLTIEKITVGSTIRIEQLFFDADSTSLRMENYPVLDEIYEFMNSHKSVAVEIGGHTNTIPPHDYCDKLSTDRARNVAFYLYRKGISESRLSFRGYGKRQPLTEDRSSAGRQRNQRVELKILTK